MDSLFVLYELSALARSLHSLNHDLFAVFYDDALKVVADLLTSQVEHDTVLCGSSLHVLDSGSV